MSCRSDKCGDRVKPRSGGILLAVGVSPRNLETSGEGAAVSGVALDVALSGLEEESNVCLHPVG